MEILLGIIGTTIFVMGVLYLIGLSASYDITSPYYISKDGRYGYRKSFIERFIDAWEHFHRF